MTRRGVGLALVLLVLAFTGAACSERDTTGPVDGGDGGGGGEVREVLINNFAFAAQEVTIDRGQTVRWRNTTSTFHTVTPDGHTAFAERQTNAVGQTFQTRFDTPGRYEYHCAPHEGLGMRGVIIVR